MHRFDMLIDAMIAIDIMNAGSRREVDRQLALTIDDQDLRQYLLQNLVRNEQGLYWRANLAAIRSNMKIITGFPEELSQREYTGPALFLAGVNSNLINLETTPAINQHFPSATIDYIKNAGHWLHTDQPDIIVKKINDFLIKALHASATNS
jgi:pimeloyl-ACP methyl ester carboxylesterase